MSAAAPAAPPATAPATPLSSAVVFHAGALGDSVMIWPLLRAMQRAIQPGYCSVTLVAAMEKATLAAREVGVEAVDSERPECTGLWASRPAPALLAGSTLVISFVADSSTDAGQRWMAAVRASCQNAELFIAGPPGSESRAALWRRFDADSGGAVEPRAAPSGPVLLHVGAGSPLKRWPLDRFLALNRELRDHAHLCGLLAGEVEAERFSPAELARFRDHGGVVCESLAELAGQLRTARLVVCGDSGPGHLAAQLGVPTLSLFGPTDPQVWAPIGPRVSVLAPPLPTGNMQWLETAPVIARALSMLDSTGPVT